MDRLQQFEYLMIRFERPVYRFIRARVDSKEDAQDIMQTAFLRCYKNIDRFDEAENVAGLVFIIVKRSLFDWYRTQKRNKEYCTSVNELLERSEESDGNHEALAFDWLLDFRSAFVKLKPSYAQVLTLHYLDGYSCQDISQELGVSLGSVKVLLHRARTALKSLI